jgi:exonuclease III
MNITTNNNNNITSNNNPPPRSYTPFRIMTQNIQGLSSPVKQKQVIDMMTINNIQILGLSETKLSKRQSKLIYFKNDLYKAYFTNDSDSPMGSGVGIILSRDYYRYVHRSSSYKGRVIHVDLFMKGRVKLRIIQLYSHANFTGTRNSVEELNKYMIDLLKQSRRDRYHVILMGDFNVSQEAYLQEYHRTGTCHWKYNLLHYLYHSDLKETIDLFHDVTLSTPFNTFIPRQQTSSPSRIDAIWIS